MITDNTFTAEELKTALAANKELVKILVPALKEQQFQVLTTDEHTALVTKTANDAAIAERNKATSEIYSALDTDIKTAFGIEKTGPEEKTYDYLKRAAKSKTDEVAALNEKIKTGSGDTVLKQQLEAAQTEANKYKVAADKLTLDIAQARIRSHVEQGLTGIAFRADLPDILVRPVINSQMDELIKNAKEVDGKIIFHDATGKAILTGSNVSTPAEILKDRLKEIIDPERTLGGGGTNPPKLPVGKATGVKNAEGVDIVVPETIKNKVELHEYLGKQGLSSMSEEFIKIDESYKELPVQ